MTDHDEAIDRLLDQLASGEIPGQSSLDSQSITAAASLFAAGQEPLPDPAFRRRLELMLFEQTPSAAGGVLRARHAGFGIALQPGLPHWRPRTMLATAAILALVMLSALSVVRLGDTPNGGNTTLAGVFQAASASAHSGEKSPASFDITLDGRALTLPEASVVAGMPVILAVTNHGDHRASFTIEGINLSAPVEPGETTSLSLNFEAGVYVLKIDSLDADDEIIAGSIRAIDARPTTTPVS